MSSIKNSKDASFTEVCRTLYDVPNIRAMEVAKLYRRQILEDAEYCSFYYTKLPSYTSMLDSFAQKALVSLTECNLDGTYSLTLSELQSLLYLYPEKYSELCAGREVLLSAHLDDKVRNDVSETRQAFSMCSLSLYDRLHYWGDTINSWRNKFFYLFIESINPDRYFDFSKSLHTFTELYFDAESDVKEDTWWFRSYHLSDSVYILSLTLPEIFSGEVITVDMSNIKVF